MSTCKRGCMVFSQKDKVQFCIVCGKPEARP
jgi:hypothetical protein